MVPQTKNSWMNRTLVILLVIGAAIFAYAPGLNGPFVLDDGENITQNDGVAITAITLQSLEGAAASNESGLLKRPFAALSFGLNHYFAGGFENTFPYKATNLGIHLANTLLIAVLAGLLLRTPAFRKVDPLLKTPIAVAIAAVWALHPLQLTSVLYVVQRMTTLSTFFVLAGLITFCIGRLRLEGNRANGLALMYGGVLAGTLSGLTAKENAALLPLFAAAVEFSLFYSAGARTNRTDLRVFYLLTFLLPVFFVCAFLLVNPDFVLKPYAERAFSPVERLLTETRILWHYLGLLLLPDPHRLGLFQDDIGVSQGLFRPPQTALALFALVSTLGLAVALARYRPAVALGVLWFLSGHAIESTIFGLELAYEHRNYTASFGVIFCLIGSAAPVLTDRPEYRRPFAAIMVLLASALAFTTWTRAHTWSEIRQLAFTEVRHHPNSPRALDFAARVSLVHDRDILAAINFTERGINTAPREPGFFIDMRILLAALEMEINKSRSALGSGAFVASGSFALKGAPDTIRVSLIGNRFRLSHIAADRAALESMLAREPVSAHTIVSLETLSRCMDKADTGCDILRTEAIFWLSSAARNERSTPVYRAIIETNLARAHARLGDYERALDHMGRARALVPSEPSFLLGQVEYLLRTGRLAEARRALDACQTDGGSFGRKTTRHAETVNFLESLYSKLSAAQPTRRKLN